MHSVWQSEKNSMLESNQQIQSCLLVSSKWPTDWPDSEVLHLLPMYPAELQEFLGWELLHSMYNKDEHLLWWSLNQNYLWKDSFPCGHMLQQWWLRRNFWLLMEWSRNVCTCLEEKSFCIDNFTSQGQIVPVWTLCYCISTFVLQLSSHMAAFRFSSSHLQGDTNPSSIMVESNPLVCACLLVTVFNICYFR